MILININVTIIKVARGEDKYCWPPARAIAYKTCLKSR